jgi:N-formylglutamate amidohydrolase
MISDVPIVPNLDPDPSVKARSDMKHVRILTILTILLIVPRPTRSEDDLLIIRHGTLPIVISAPHGGSLSLPGVDARKGDRQVKGASGFRTSRDTGTEELALLIADELAERFGEGPTCVISRLHRRYVDFNRPPEIGVEHRAARSIYDVYHQTLITAVRNIRADFGSGLLLDIHGQGSSPVTVYRGTSNGLTTSTLRNRFGDAAQTGDQSLMGLLAAKSWTVHPRPFGAKEQAGFTGGHIVRTYGSHRADGIDAIQLEFGGDYRSVTRRNQTAKELADAIEEYSRMYLQIPVREAGTQTNSGSGN